MLDSKSAVLGAFAPREGVVEVDGQTLPICELTLEDREILSGLTEITRTQTDADGNVTEIVAREGAPVVRYNATLFALGVPSLSIDDVDDVMKALSERVINQVAVEILKLGGADIAEAVEEAEGNSESSQSSDSGTD